MSRLLTVAGGVAGGLLLVWLALLAALWWGQRANPDRTGLREALRLLPDLVRLLRRLAADPSLPRAVRVRLWLLLAYLLLPLDLVPDFIPVLGYADDAIIVAIALRSVTRAAGPAALDRHWPGTPDGLATVRRLAGLSPALPPRRLAGSGRRPSRADPPGTKLTGWQWMFRSRRTGRLTIVQWPNPPLWVWIATTLARRLPSVAGRADTVLAVAGTAALVLWALGEVWRGVNPWRRLLGVAVLVGVAISTVAR